MSVHFPINPRRIAEVGNGPLKDDDVKYINEKFDLVARFNHAPDMQDSDKLHVLFLRAYNPPKNGIHVLDGRGAIHTIVNKCKNYPAIVIFSMDISVAKIKQIIGDIPYITSPYSPVYTEIETGVVGPGETLHMGGECYSWGWTTGFLGICFLRNKYPFSEIDVFGMNWSSDRFEHPWEVEKKLIPTIVTRVHHTKKDTYRM